MHGREPGAGEGARARGARRALLGALALLATLAAPAAARDPITPLQDVHRGLLCTARTVVQGTDIASFDVEVLDVVADADGTGPRILVRVSGPAVAQTGVAEGFSGSPVYCPDAHGTIGNAGAISATVGQYGEDVALVTPIELMLGLPLRPPSSVHPAPKLLRAAKPLASPLVLSGLAPSLARLVERAGRRAGRPVVAAPAGPLGSFAPQELVPGASLAVAYSRGAVTAGAVGTVSYRDGAKVYGFGHPLDGAGRRALLLEDAYVYTVVANPLDIPDLGAASYKLAAPGHALGTLSNDAPNGVVGSLGATPPTIPLTVRVRDEDRKRTLRQQTDIVDEVDVGDPSGQSIVPTIASIAVAQAVTAAFDGAPGQETGRLCLRVRLREAPEPLHVCKRTVLDAAVGEGLPAPLALTMAQDVANALTQIEAARFARLHITELTAGVTIDRGARLATMLAVRGPHKVRPGGVLHVALLARVLRGRERVFHLRVRIPRDARPGRRVLLLTGTPLDGPDGGGADALSALLQLFGGGNGPRGAQSLPELTFAFSALARYDGIRAKLGHDRWPVYRDPRLRIDGDAALPIRILPRAPAGG